MRGRKPLPLEVRRQTGNPGHRPIPVDAPEPPAAVPNCPPHVQGEARNEWRRISIELVRLNLVSRIDKAALAMYCQYWQRWIEAEDAVRDLGLVTTAFAIREYLRRKHFGAAGRKTLDMGEKKQEADNGLLFPGMDLTSDDKDYPGKNPYLSIAESCMDRMQKILVEFGMTPSSRARVRSTPIETTDEIETALEMAGNNAADPSQLQ